MKKQNPDDETMIKEKKPHQIICCKGCYELGKAQQKKEDLKLINKFAEDSDIDGRGISFSFYDTDLEELKEQLETK